MLMKPASRSAILKRAMHGATTGVGAAGVLCCLAAVGMLLSLSIHIKTRHGGSINGLYAILGYLVAGIVGGTLFGAFSPWVSSRILSYLLGTVMGIPLALIGMRGMVTASGVAANVRVLLVIVMVLSGFVGLLIRHFVLLVEQKSLRE